MTELQYKDAIAYFLSFCVEIYKNAHQLSGAEAYLVLAESGAMAYLEANYEPIHTQSPQWILEEIEDFLSNHNT